MKDLFAPKAADVGDLQYIIVRKSGGGLGGDWHLQEVEVWHPGMGGGRGDVSFRGGSGALHHLSLHHPSLHCFLCPRHIPLDALPLSPRPSSLSTAMQKRYFFPSHLPLISPPSPQPCRSATSSCAMTGSRGPVSAS